MCNKMDEGLPEKTAEILRKTAGCLVLVILSLMMNRSREGILEQVTT